MLFDNRQPIINGAIACLVSFVRSQKLIQTANFCAFSHIGLSNQKI